MKKKQEEITSLSWDYDMLKLQWDDVASELHEYKN